MRKPGRNLEWIRRWDDARAVLIDLPKEAKTAVEFSVAVEELAQPPGKQLVFVCNARCLTA